jgi:3D (Asp-Asp-Asp) domain-containing protein
LKAKILSVLLVLGIILFALHTVDKNVQEQIASCNKPIEVMQEVESLPEVVESSESEVIIADIYYYCSCEKCTGKSFDNPSRGITANGRLARENHTIAMDNHFPFGTLVEIDGNVYEVEDRGQLIRGNKIDIYVPSHEEALRRGHRTSEVKIIRWGQGEE